MWTQECTSVIGRCPPCTVGPGGASPDREACPEGVHGVVVVVLPTVCPRRPRATPSSSPSALQDQGLAPAPPPPCAQGLDLVFGRVRRRAVRVSGAAERQNARVRASPARARRATKPHGVSSRTCLTYGVWMNRSAAGRLTALRAPVPTALAAGSSTNRPKPCHRPPILRWSASKTRRRRRPR